VKKTLTILGALLLGATLYNASAGIIITIDENGMVLGTTTEQ